MTSGAKAVTNTKVGGAVSATTVTATGEISGSDLKATGLTGATAGNTRIVGATTSGAPITGTFAQGDVVVDQTGTIWICTTAGTPGTWTNEISNSLVVRSATATAGTGEFTIYGTSGITGQTITLPVSALNGALYQIKNLSPYTVNILGGTSSISVSGTVYAAATPYTIPLNAAYTFVYSGGIWYCMVTTDLGKMAGQVPATNGGNGNTVGITAAQFAEMPTGAITETYSRFVASTNISGTTSVLKFTPIYLTAGSVVNNINLFTGSTAGATLTHEWAGIFTLSGTTMTLVAETADQLLTSMAATTLFTWPLLSAYTVPTSGLYYVAASITGTTMPTLAGTIVWGNTAPYLTMVVTGPATPPTIGTTYIVSAQPNSVYYYLS